MCLWLASLSTCTFSKGLKLPHFLDVGYKGYFRDALAPRNFKSLLFLEDAIQMLLLFGCIEPRPAKPRDWVIRAHTHESLDSSNEQTLDILRRIVGLSCALCLLLDTIVWGTDLVEYIVHFLSHNNVFLLEWADSDIIQCEPVIEGRTDFLGQLDDTLPCIRTQWSQLFLWMLLFHLLVVITDHNVSDFDVRGFPFGKLRSLHYVGLNIFKLRHDLWFLLIDVDLALIYARRAAILGLLPDCLRRPSAFDLQFLLAKTLRWRLRVRLEAMIWQHLALMWRQALFNTIFHIWHY